MNTNINKEIRRLNGEIRSESRHIEGYAIVFNSQSDDLGFYETILPTAIDDELIRSSDVFALFNHDKDKVWHVPSMALATFTSPLTTRA